MADTTFVDGVTLTAAAWFNDVNDFYYTTFAAATTVTLARAAMLLGAPTAAASTFTFDGSGGTTGSVSMTYQKNGRIVTLTIPPTLGTSGTSSTVMNSDTALPADIRPAAAQCMLAQIHENGAAVAQGGLINVTSAGIVQIFKSNNVTGNFPNATANCGLGISHTITYLIP